MSAYALFPFASYITSTNEKEPANLHNNGMINLSPELSEHKIAICIRVKAAHVNVGVLTRPTRPKSPSSKHSKQPSTSSFSLPDDAVLFKLSICFNGRKYTATRSFATFKKLRKDLIRELNQVNHYAQHRSRDHRHQGCFNEATSSTTLPQLPESISDQVDGNCHFNLPSMSSGISMAMAAASVPLGTGGITGFTKLQSLLLCYYCPLMECWLKGVMEIIDYDTSPCFNNFLWEPLRDNEDSVLPPTLCSSTTSSNCATEQHSIRKKHSFGSSLSLCSINESFENNCDE